MLCLGIGKTQYHSSACTFHNGERGIEIELALTERVTRKKASGVWPERALSHLNALREVTSSREPLHIAENRDVSTPQLKEDTLDQLFPFYEHLTHIGLQRYVRRFNSDIEFVTHHHAHAMAAVALSPFSKCVIVVLDGAGTVAGDFPRDHEAAAGRPESSKDHEECSVYLHNEGQLECVFKRWRCFRPGKRNPERVFSDGIGIYFENTSEYIFNCNQSAGKVMGLAAFGQAGPRDVSRADHLDLLDWKKAFRSKGKIEWERSVHFDAYANLAATVQHDYEEELQTLLTGVGEKYPDYRKLILTGGCALNCSANGKILRRRLFDQIYVPPFPGDDGIGLGAASHLFYGKVNQPWEPTTAERQRGYFGPLSSVPSDAAVREEFGDYPLIKPPSIADYVAQLLASGNVVGWFQGRSESGPRALGNRSILANPQVRGIKDRLNRTIKFREDFRPYGASCLQEKASEYFEIPPGFDSPFMAFAVTTRPTYRAALQEVSHRDNTSRMQTVRRGQNPQFYDLISHFGQKTGLFCLLNTSLNVMGEPIVETLADAKKLFAEVAIDGIAVGNYYVQRPK